MPGHVAFLCYHHSISLQTLVGTDRVGAGAGAGAGAEVGVEGIVPTTPDFG